MQTRLVLAQVWYVLQFWSNLVKEFLNTEHDRRFICWPMQVPLIWRRIFIYMQGVRHAVSPSLRCRICKMCLLQDLHYLSWVAALGCIAKIKLTSSLVTLSVNGCPGTWTRYRDSDYCISNVTLSMASASHMCQQFDAELVSIHSSKENEFIATRLP